jgi:hypothetical protein
MSNMIQPSYKLRADDIFFPAMALVILGVVFVGFAQSYFLAGMVHAKLPNALVHIHGAIFVIWIFLLVIQNALFACRKIKWHMAVGVLGVIVPPLMVIFGVLTLFDSIRRNGTGIPPQLLLTGDLEELLLFAALIAWGMIVRRSSAAHKRLMIMGTLAIMGPAINRWPFSDAMRLPGTILIILALPLLVVFYDFWSLRRVHYTTIVGTLIPATHLPIWIPVIDWIRRT